jgi:hypothetical protein
VGFGFLLFPPLSATVHNSAEPHKVKRTHRNRLLAATKRYVHTMAVLKRIASSLLLLPRSDSP